METVGSAREQLAGGSVSAGAGWVRSALAALPLPTAPVMEPWELSIAALVRRDREFPWAADKALGVLDRFGSVRLSADMVGFDESDIDWDDVVEVRSSYLVDHLSTRALDQETARIRSLLPPFPGRARVVRAAGESIMTLSLAAMGRAIQDGPASKPVASALIHRSRLGRRTETVAGITATAILAGLPAVNDALVATARSRGIPVSVDGEDRSTAMERAMSLRAAIDGLSSRRDRPALPSGDPDDEA